MKELNAKEDILRSEYSTLEERNFEFNVLVKKLTRDGRQKLQTLRSNSMQPLMKRIENKLAKAAVSMGFVEVLTPTFISKSFVKKMGIKETDSLWKQIFWLDGSKCLRPMLAPNLYQLLYYLSKIWREVKIFEIGSCFRRDTRGQQHLNEFTMFNIVEMSPHLNAEKRVREIVDSIMRQIKLFKYELKKIPSDVYGETYDIIVNNIEVASAVAGPHPLDENWNITDPWAGAGFGVERLTMVIGNFNNITRVGRSLIYLDGVRLNL